MTEPSIWRRLLPALTPVSQTERLRSAIGAAIGIFLTGWLTRLALGPSDLVPILVAPMGASAVLLFAVPSSPLAQPWSILGGNAIAAVVGVTAAVLVPDQVLAAAAGVGIAIALMLACRCVHPPSGAVALTAVLGGPAIHALGYGFVVWPIAINSLVLLGTAFLFNNLTGRPYPHHAAGRSGPALARSRASAVGATRAADLQAVMREYGELIDVSPDVLADLMQRAEMRARARHAGPITCGEIMCRDVIAVSPDAPIAEAFRTLRHHHIKSLPVTDDRARVVGIVTQTDLLDKSDWGRNGPRVGIRTRARRSLVAGSAARGLVREIMSSEVATATAATPVDALLEAIARGGHHHFPVVDADRRLIGIVTQSDIVMSLAARAMPADVPRTASTR